MIIKLNIDDTNFAVAEVEDSWTLKDLNDIREDGNYAEIQEKKTKSIKIVSNGMVLNTVAEIEGNYENIDVRLCKFYGRYLSLAVENLFLSTEENIEVS